MRGRIVLLVLLGVAGGLFALRGPLALRVMDRVLSRTMAADPIAELPDGLHVLLCGAGGPLPDPVRSGPCAAVIAGRSMVVVDAGTGGARNLQRLGFTPGRSDAQFLTHFHSDHIDGLGEMAMLRWTGAAHDTPLPVYGPAGVEEVVAGFDGAYRQDASYRVAHHGAATVPPSGAGMTAQPFAPPAPGEAPVVYESNGLRVTAFAVDHDPVRPAVGYRFEYGGRSLVVSGDTKKSANLEAQARGVDCSSTRRCAAARARCTTPRWPPAAPTSPRSPPTSPITTPRPWKPPRSRRRPARSTCSSITWCRRCRCPGSIASSSRASRTPTRAASRSGATAR
jgi:ribonuclease Z